MQDPQNTSPRVARFKRLYRTTFDQLPDVLSHKTRTTDSYKEPAVFPLLGINAVVQVVHDPNIPTCLINGLDRYADDLQEDQLDDVYLDTAERTLGNYPVTISNEPLQMETDVISFFRPGVAMPVRNLCLSIGLNASYRRGPTEEHINPDHAWVVGDDNNILAIFEHKSPTVANHHFPVMISRARTGFDLNLAEKATGGESILAKVILVSLARGLNFAAVLSFKDFIFIHLVQLGATQWQARISDIIPLTAQETPIISVVLALVLHSRNDEFALRYQSLEEEATDPDNVSLEPAEGSNLGPPGAGPHAPTNPPTGEPPGGHNTGGQMPGPNMLAVSEYWEPRALSEDALASLLNTIDGISFYWDMKPFSGDIFHPVRREDSSLWGGSLPSMAVPRLVTNSHTDHHLTPPPSPPMIPFVLRLNSQVGRGSTGSAYQGCFLGLPLQLVVKTLPADRMDHELKIWRQLRHLAGTSIPGLFGAYAIEGKEGFADTGALVQQHGGPTLSSFDVLTQDQRNELYRTVTRIHEAGVEHGDLRPTNVTLKEDGGVMVIDFSHSFPHECTGRTCEELRCLRQELGLQG